MHDVYGDHSEQICCTFSYTAETLSFQRSCLEHSWTSCFETEPELGHDIQSLVKFSIEKLRLRLLISELAVDCMSIVCANSLFKESILTNVGCCVWLAA